MSKCSQQNIIQYCTLTKSKLEPTAITKTFNIKVLKGNLGQITLNMGNEVFHRKKLKSQNNDNFTEYF